MEGAGASDGVSSADGDRNVGHFRRTSGAGRPYLASRTHTVSSTCKNITQLAAKTGEEKVTALSDISSFVFSNILFVATAHSESPSPQCRHVLTLSATSPKPLRASYTIPHCFVTSRSPRSPTSGRRIARRVHIHTVHPLPLVLSMGHTPTRGHAGPREKLIRRFSNGREGQVSCIAPL